MNSTDPSAARPWALLDVVADRGREPDPGPAFGGVVAVAASGRVGALRDGLRSVPDDVGAVVYLDAVAEGTTALVSDLLDRLEDGDDAVVPAVPVTDALKRVAGERVVSSVDRRGLYGVGSPQVLRRSALAAVLESAPVHESPGVGESARVPASPPAGRVDPAVLLLAAGRPVRVVPVDPAGGVRGS